eukprot:SAG11_NODE_20127_length_452_cov_0.878187_1_plen_55_part_01
MPSMFASYKKLVRLIRDVGLIAFSHLLPLKLSLQNVVMQLQKLVVYEKILGPTKT